VGNSRIQTEVVVVGGGIVGLTCALFLQYHGVDFVLVERNLGSSPIPRSRGVHARSVELYRQLGLEERVQAAAAGALAMGRFGGARRGPTLVASEPLAFSPGTAGPGGLAQDPSPSRFCFCPQPLLEPVLRGALAERGGAVRLGVEAAEVEQDSDGVEMTIREVRSGSVGRVRTRFLIAADGAGSSIRRHLGVTSWELPPTHHYLNHYFRGDLRRWVEGRTFSQCEITGSQVRGVLLSKNNVDEWSFHLEYDPGKESLSDYTRERSTALIRAAIGVPDLEVEVISVGAWDTGVAVADTYRLGRVLLIGDAAHRHAPWGGFGANTGIADAQNLAWKVAAALRGSSGEALLDSYTAERRPGAVLAAKQARLRTDFDARYGIANACNAADIAGQVEMSAVMVRQQYASSALLGDGDHGTVVELRGQVGTRLPHLWVRNGETERSTLDLVGPGWAVLAADDALPVWQRAAGGLSDTVRAAGTGGREWAEATRLLPGGALLVRPDQIVAARSDLGLTPERLRGVLGALQRGAAADVIDSRSRSGV
jgi:putative polyketide hydroxylase